MDAEEEDEDEEEEEKEDGHDEEELSYKLGNLIEEGGRAQQPAEEGEGVVRGVLLAGRGELSGDS